MSNAILSLLDAAKLAQKTKPTLLNHIKKGKLNAKKDELGRWKIDVAELQRVYDLRKEVEKPLTENFNDTNHLNLQADLQLKLALAEKENQHLKDALSKAEQREQQLMNLAMQNGRLLEDKTSTQKKKWWHW